MKSRTYAWMSVLTIVAMAGCRHEERTPIPLETRADSVAYRLFEAWGGPTAWERVRFVRFNFAVARVDETPSPVRHLWDRYSGDYRVEWRAGTDTTVVVLFNVNTREGSAYVNGAEAQSSFAPTVLAEAYRRFINDTYWFMAPVKLFDPGVHREYAADSSSSEYDVLALTFGEVGLTPGDRYWLYVDRTDGSLAKWKYILQGWTGQPASSHVWEDYADFETAGGVVRVARRKRSESGRSTIVTDAVSFPASVDQAVFSRIDREME